jgi:hypothetical protein
MIISDGYSAQSGSVALSFLLLILSLALCAGTWCIGTFLGSIGSGWHALTKRFRAEVKSDSQWRSIPPFSFSVRLRKWADYGSIIRIANEEDALFLGVAISYRVGHPPLRIPWTEIKIARTRSFWQRFVLLTLGDQERIPMRISERMARKLGILARMPSDAVSK